MKKCFYAVLAVLALSSCAKDIEPGDEYYTDKDYNGLLTFSLIEYQTTDTSLSFYVSRCVWSQCVICRCLRI